MLLRLARNALLFIVILGASQLLTGCGSTPPAVPVASFTALEASDKSFSAQVPAGWETKSSDAGATVATAQISQGAAIIRIVSDTASSFLGDAARNSPKPPMEVVHELKLKKLEEYFSSPQPGATKEMGSSLGPARYSEFTAANGQIKGWRCTILGPQRAFFITVSCPTTNWDTLQPAFSKVIASLQAGSE